jgi:hypothetical protein
MDIYQRKYSELTKDEQRAIEFAAQTLIDGDVLYHESDTVWMWALMFVKHVLEKESNNHTKVDMYVQFIREYKRFGVSIVKTS